MDFLVVAGEVSGDHHAAPVIAALKSKRADSSFWGLGGDHMIAQDFDALHHVRDLSVTGFVEVIKHLSFFQSVMRDIVDRCRERKPDAALLIDYPGFNLRLGLKLKQMGIPVYYYISPQVWAWKKGRVKTMRRFLRHMFVIFPFEEGFYAAQNIEASFVGHPLVEKDFHLKSKEAFIEDHGLVRDLPLLAVLPGSRRNELQRLAPSLVGAITRLVESTPELQVCVAALKDLSPDLYKPLAEIPQVHLVYDDPYNTSYHADAAIVASGTASLEVAFLGTPLVVVYKVAPLSYLIAKALVHVDHLAMPNLILEEGAITELIQGDASPKRIAREASALLFDPTRRSTISNKLSHIKDLLGEPGCAERVSNAILKDLVKA